MNNITFDTVTMDRITMDTVTMGNSEGYSQFDIMEILQIIIASSGIVTNLIVVIVFLNDAKLRRKTPNICIINQVGGFHI